MFGAIVCFAAISLALFGAFVWGQRSGERLAVSIYEEEFDRLRGIIRRWQRATGLTLKEAEQQAENDGRQRRGRR